MHRRRTTTSISWRARLCSDVTRWRTHRIALFPFTITKRRRWPVDALLLEHWRFSLIHCQSRRSSKALAKLRSTGWSRLFSSTSARRISPGHRVRQARSVALSANEDKRPSSCEWERKRATSTGNERKSPRTSRFDITRHWNGKEKNSHAFF